jgi:hypothetical protein
MVNLNLSKETLQKISKDFQTEGSIKTNKGGNKVTYTYSSDRGFDELMMEFTTIYEQKEKDFVLSVEMKFGSHFGVMSKTMYQYESILHLTEKQFIKLVRYNLDLTTELLGIYDLEKGIK